MIGFITRTKGGSNGNVSWKHDTPTLTMRGAKRKYVLKTRYTHIICERSNGNVSWNHVTPTLCEGSNRTCVLKSRYTYINCEVSNRSVRWKHVALNYTWGFKWKWGRGQIIVCLESMTHIITIEMKRKLILKASQTYTCTTHSHVQNMSKVTWHKKNKNKKKCYQFNWLFYVPVILASILSAKNWYWWRQCKCIRNRNVYLVCEVEEDTEQECLPCRWSWGGYGTGMFTL